MPSLQRDFDAQLSFAQELRETPLGSGLFLPASNTIANPGVEGVAKFHFNSDFSVLEVEMDVRGDLSGDRMISLAHLHLDPTSSTGPLTVELFPNPIAVVAVKKNHHFSLKIKLTNDNIIPRKNDNFSTNTIASLYHAIRGQNLYIDTHGMGDYVLGLIRGQIY
jgi:hypothetical protein